MSLLRLRDPVSRLRLALIALPALLSMGTAAYWLFLDDVTVFDAFYMTLITVSTVGFREVVPLGLAGRVVTTGLILCGVFLVAFSTASFIESIVEGELARHFGRRRLEQRIAELKGHWIICGFGRMGEQVAQEMRKSPHAPPIVIIDNSEERARYCEESNLLYLQADATHEETLEAAGISRAKGLVSLVSSDAENVFICLTARGLAPKLTIIARALEERSEDKLRRAGADKVVSPYVVGGHRLSLAVTQPAVAEFLEFAAGHDLQLEMEETHIGEGSPLAGVELRNSGLRSDLDLIVLAIRRAAGEMLFNPKADTVLEAGDTLIAMGPGTCLAQLHKRARDSR